MSSSELIVALRSFLVMLRSMAPISTARLLRGVAWTALGTLSGLAVTIMAVADSVPPLPGLLLLAPAAAIIAARLAAAGWLARPVAVLLGSMAMAGVVGAGVIAFVSGQTVLAAGCVVSSTCLVIGGLMVLRARHSLGAEMSASFAPQAAALEAIRFPPELE